MPWSLAVIIKKEMKTKTSIFTLLIFVSAFCYGQKKYFQPKGIIDKTEEYVKSKVGWISLKNKERVDGYTRIGNSIYGGTIGCNVKPLKGIDLKTFKVLAGSNYAKDKNYLYYPQVEQIIVDADCQASFYSEIIVRKVKPERFKYLGNDYGTDGKSVFYRGYKIEVADSKTFRIIIGPKNFYFAVDKRHVYNHDEIFKEADPATFNFDKDDPRNNENRFIIRDKNKVWEYKPPYCIVEIK